MGDRGGRGPVLVLTVTPLVLRFTPAGWEPTAPILPIVVDVAVVIVVRVDTIVARLDGDAGFWPALLRWLTGTMTLALNVGDSALRGDLVGVGVHAVAPTLLIVTAEASLKWRRAITVAVARIDRERAEAEALKTVSGRRPKSAHGPNCGRGRTGSGPTGSRSVSTPPSSTVSAVSTMRLWSASARSGPRSGPPPNGPSSHGRSATTRSGPTARSGRRGNGPTVSARSRKPRTRPSATAGQRTGRRSPPLP